MHSIWSFLQQTAAASATVLLLLLLRRIFRDKLSPRCLCALWTVFPIRLLIPVGLLGFVTTLDLTYPVDLLRTAIELNAGSAYSSPWLSDLPALPIPLPPTAAPRSVTDWLFLIYLAGVLGFESISCWPISACDASCGKPFPYLLKGARGSASWRPPINCPCRLRLLPSPACRLRFWLEYSELPLSYPLRGWTSR